MARLLLLDGGALERLAFLLERQASELLAGERRPRPFRRLRARLLCTRAALDDGAGGGGGPLRLLGAAGAGALVDELIHVGRVIHTARLYERHGLLARDDLAALPELR